jgi:hypothetical protein
MPGRRRTPAEKARITAALVGGYTAGHTIRRLATDQGVGYGTARNLLLAAGVTLRPRGGWKRKSQGGKP